MSGKEKEREPFLCRVSCAEREQELNRRKTKRRSIVSSRREGEEAMEERVKEGSVEVVLSTDCGVGLYLYAIERQ